MESIEMNNTDPLSMFLDFSLYDEDIDSSCNSFRSCDASVTCDDKFLDSILQSLFNESQINRDETSSEVLPCGKNTISVLGVELDLYSYSEDNVDYISNNDISFALDETELPVHSSNLLEEDVNNNLENSESIQVIFPHMYEENYHRRRNLLYENTCRTTKDGTSATIFHAKLPEKPSETFFVCPVEDCHKIYAKHSHLKAHLKRHSGEKPFICNWKNCTWKFSRSDELARHKRSHSGVKPYKCELCEKAFTRSDHLAKHRKVHKKKTMMHQIGSYYKSRTKRNRRINI